MFRQNTTKIMEQRQKKQKSVVWFLRSCTKLSTTVAADRGITASTLSAILKAKNAIISVTSSGNASKKKKKTLETTTHDKFKVPVVLGAKRGPVNRKLVQQKALCFARLLGAST